MRFIGIFVRMKERGFSTIGDLIWGFGYHQFFWTCVICTAAPIPAQARPGFYQTMFAVFLYVLLIFAMDDVP